MMKIKFLGNNQVMVEDKFTYEESGEKMIGRKFLFHSYDSDICLIILVDKDSDEYKTGHAGNIILFKDWNYSRTTGKYRKQFIKEVIGLDTTPSLLEKAIRTKTLNDVGSDKYYTVTYIG
jgi:hypothetical protein